MYLIVGLVSACSVLVFDCLCFVCFTLLMVVLSGILGGACGCFLYKVGFL